VSPVRYELGFHIPEDEIFHSHCRENLKSYMSREGCLVLLQLGLPCNINLFRICSGRHIVVPLSETQ
jgi:hypothetical protein